MVHKKIGFEKPIYIFILVFIILFSYTILSNNPPESKIPIPYSIDDINDSSQPNDINNVSPINESIIDNVTYEQSIKVK